MEGIELSGSPLQAGDCLTSFNKDPHSCVTPRDHIETPRFIQTQWTFVRSLFGCDCENPGEGIQPASGGVVYFKAAIEGSIATQAGVSVQRFSKSLRKGKSTDFLRGRHVLDIEVSEGVTTEGVEVILERIYGQFGHHVSDQNFMTYLPAAYFFSDEDLCDQCGIYIRSIAYSPENILIYFHFASAYDFGPYSELLLRNCLIYLCKEGTANAALNPTDIYSKLDYNWLAQIVGSDVFYVKNESDRFLFLTQAIKAKDADEFGRIREFLSGSTIMNFSDNIFASSGRLAKNEDYELEKVHEAGLDIDGEPADQQVPTSPTTHDAENQEYLETEAMYESESDVEGGALVTKRESQVTFQSKRMSTLGDIVEDADEEEPTGRTLSVSTYSKPPTAVPANIFHNNVTTSSPLASEPPLYYHTPHALRIRTLNHKKSFKERRDASRFFGSSEINSTANAIELISNGVIYTHMNSTTLSKLKAEGVISPHVLGIQHRASIDLQNRIKKSSPKSIALGIKYVNDRVGVSEKIRRDLEADETVSPSSILPPPCFYDWVFLDPFRHKLSEVQPFRFAAEFPLAK
ncbi:UNVERIFIED_CONTAM: hypothetical protein HDU68_002890, partial [Siphonaria sp. JEL0065]